MIKLLAKNGKLNLSLPIHEYAYVEYLVLSGFENSKYFDEIKQDVSDKTRLHKSVTMNVLDTLVNDGHIEVHTDGLAINDRGKEYLKRLKENWEEYWESD